MKKGTFKTKELKGKYILISDNNSSLNCKVGYVVMVDNGKIFMYDTIERTGRSFDCYDSYTLNYPNDEIDCVVLTKIEYNRIKKRFLKYAELAEQMKDIIFGYFHNS